MERKEIQTDKAPQAIGPYSQAIQVGELVYTSGQIPLDPKTQDLIGSDLAEEQTKQVMENLSAVLQAAGTGMDRVIKTTIFLKNLDDFQKVNEVYESYLSDPYPARSTVEVSKLPKNVLVEIECIAKV